jgi:hypothetical protein
MGCGAKADKDAKMEKGGDSDCSSGPIQNRSCTDPQCCLLFVVHWVLFVLVAAMGFGGGNPERLVYPRDFQGNYCGTDDNWKTNAMLKEYKKSFLTMNTSSVIDEMAKQFICGTSGKAILTSGSEPLMTTADYEASCGKSMLSLSPEELQAQASKYSDPSQAAALMSGSGSSILSEITKYFYAACVPKCDVAAGGTITNGRTYKYVPSGAEPWGKVWNKMLENAAALNMESTMDKFTFTALPESVCPYDPMYCIPFPGLEFEEAAGYCVPKLNAAAKAAASAAMNSALDGIASSGASEAVESNFGTMVGDLQTSIDVFIIVCIISLIVGFTFLVILRYTVGVVVWLSILLVFLFFSLGGLLCVIRSGQCKGETMEDAGNSLKDSAAANGTSVTAPECADGYLYPDEDQREMIKIVGFILLGIAGVWALIICCMFKRIQIAIAINKVAADYVGDTKMIITVPVVQILAAIVWWIIWLFAAIFIVSQVPDGYLEQGPWTYLEALGDKDTAGKCNGRWPTGFAYQNQSRAECNAEDQKCYQCAPPRYVVGDVRFAYVFLPALEQCIQHCSWTVHYCWFGSWLVLHKE